MSRQGLRTQLATILKAVTVPGNAGQVLAFKSVWESPPGEIQNSEMPACVVRLMKSTETRLTAPAGSGLKQVVTPVRLDIFCWFREADLALGERFLEDAADAIAVAMRTTANDTAGGQVAIIEPSETEPHDPIAPPAGADAEPGLLLCHSTMDLQATAFATG